jgi:FkbM family methyltransferase
VNAHIIIEEERGQCIGAPQSDIRRFALREFGGWYFPDHEVHLIEWLTKVGDQRDGRLRYQGKKQDLALSFCAQRRVAVDIGGHVGLWSYYLAQQFEQVHAFEPVADHRACFEQNVRAENVILYPCALGDDENSVAIHTSNGSSGDSWVSGKGDIPMRRLDEFGFSDVDLIKADCEGGELSALRGAEDTIIRCRPTIIVEQKPGRAQKFGHAETAAVDYLQSLGAQLVAHKSGDYVLTFPE